MRFVVAGGLRRSGGRPTGTENQGDPPGEETAAPGACAIYPADNLWNTDISNYPVMPDSDKYIARLAATWKLKFVANLPINVIDSVADAVPWVLILYRNGTSGDPGPMPIPADAVYHVKNPDKLVLEDNHLVLLDNADCKLYELWSVNGAKPDGSWPAGNGAIFDLTSNALRPDNLPSSAASGLPVFVGLARVDEVRSGAIRHALSIPATFTKEGFIRPATAFQSDAIYEKKFPLVCATPGYDFASVCAAKEAGAFSMDDPYNAPMGLRLRLKADYDLSGFTGEAAIFLHTAKTYGLIVTDGSGEAGGLRGESKGSLCLGLEHLTSIFNCPESRPAILKSSMSGLSFTEKTLPPPSQEPSAAPRLLLVPAGLTAGSPPEAGRHSISARSTTAGCQGTLLRYSSEKGRLFREGPMTKRKSAGSSGEKRRLPVGAEVLPAGGVHFRVWAPKRKRVEVMLEEGPQVTPAPNRAVPLMAEGNGYFSGSAPEAAVGTYYRFRLDGRDLLFPDPVSRFQPNGPFGASQVVDPAAYTWNDDEWPGVAAEGQVIYELHVGTFTREGTWAAAIEDLPRLRELGISVIELMPVADFPGRFGWGYDGVNLFAPTRLYGRPDGMRRFVDAAHGLGLGVILDVVYNHLGPSGNFLKEFAEDYFSRQNRTDWGEAINFDGENADPVREFFLANAGFWTAEYHLDGLRIDATQDIFDTSPEHILAAIGTAVRQAANGRRTLVIAENEPQQTRLIRPLESGGYGLDAVWNDDFHHSAMVALTGRNEAYYSDYQARPQEFVSLARFGFLYQGQRYRWQQKRRGSPTFGLPRRAFVNYIQNHDQIANSGQGLRCHELASPGRYRAMTAFFLLAPGTPMLFQGQEYAAATPFFYFADHPEEVAVPIQRGRTEFLRQFRSLAVPEIQARLPDPADPVTFVSCKLAPRERQNNAHIQAMHRDLLHLRHTDPVFRRVAEVTVEGAVLGEEAFVLRYFGAKGDDRLLVVNFGRDLHLDPAPEPLLAPPTERLWSILWSSEDPRYRGNGTAPLESEQNWIVPGQAAVVLQPAQAEELSPGRQGMEEKGAHRTI